MGSTTEYKVCYRDAAGTTVASSPGVPLQVHPVGVPTISTRLRLR
ncbi:hypothetical protein [Hymenobacter duratus]|nr:hypothetical protein [Hymenobacter duratus]